MQTQLGVTQHTILQDVDTWWNSNCYILQWPIEQRTALLASGAVCACLIELRAQQWNLSEKLVHLFQPFEEATCEVSGDYSFAALITGHYSYRNHSNNSNHPIIRTPPLFQEKCLIFVFQAFEHPRLKLLFQYLNTSSRSLNGGRRTSTSLREFLQS